MIWSATRNNKRMGPVGTRHRARWREWKVPTLREPCIQANVNVVKLEESRDSTYDYWLTISTLSKGQPIQVPVKLAVYHKEELTDPKTHQGKKLNTSVQLNQREGVWWLTLSYDEEVTVQTPQVRLWSALMWALPIS